MYRGHADPGDVPNPERLARVASRQQHDLGRRADRRVEIQLQLPLALGQERPQDLLQRDVAIELRGELLDRRQVAEGVEALGDGVRRGPDEAPLLQIAKMVVGDPWIEAADVARTVVLAPERVIIWSGR